MNSRARRAGVLGVAALLMAGMAPTAVTADPGAPAETATPLEAGKYIVVLKDAPVATYAGGVEGLDATKPQQGERLRSASVPATRYARHLEERQDEVRDTYDAVRPDYTFTTTLNGFAADLTSVQATLMSKDPRVKAVIPNEILQLATNESPDFLGLTGSRGLWSRAFGPNGHYGKGQVIGVIDSGIRWDNPSFADNDRMAAPPADWKGGCHNDDQEAFPDSACTNKLIGARYFNKTYTGRLAAHETQSARDINGHGSHTAGTAAGNRNVPVTLHGKDMGTVSGMAPDAHLAVYKICWDDDKGKSGCGSADSVAAIEAAVKDGVDVINYSISGSLSTFANPVELAYMNAAAAGVFVAAAAGNSGPKASTVNHPSPWLTTVANSTHKILEGVVKTGDGKSYLGQSFGRTLESSPLVHAGAIGVDGAEEPHLCGADTLDPEKAKGKIVVCDRGKHYLSVKGAEAKRAGAAGFVLLDVADTKQYGLQYPLPAVHLSVKHREALMAYVNGTENPTAAFVAAPKRRDNPNPTIADSSSRGPSLAGKGDANVSGGAVLKPDISAPGSDVLAAYSSPDLQQNWAQISGTSMATPHIAGLAALIKQARPTWSPMMIKSAMMTTAVPLRGEDGGNPFFEGAGHVTPRQFLFPGLVYDSRLPDWMNFLAGQGLVTPTPENGLTAIEPWNLNQPSISVGQLVGSATVKRTVTNVGGAPMVYDIRVKGLKGFDVKVSPERLFIGTGKTADYTLTITRTDAPVAEWRTGQVVLTDMSRRTVTSPVAVRATSALLPDNQELPAGATELTLPIRAGEDMTVTARPYGLVAGEVTAGVVHKLDAEENLNGLNPESKNNFRVDFTVPKGFHRVRVQTKLHSGFSDDVDIFVTQKGSPAVLGMAATGSGDETHDAVYLPSGDYTVHVQAYAQKGDTTEVDVRTFVLPFKDAGNVTFEPAALDLKAGETGTFTGTVKVDDPTKPYFGQVAFFRGTGADTTSLGTIMVALG